MNNNELYHYGVPGMKWGVRRAQKQSGSSPRSTYRKTKKAALDKWYKETEAVDAKYNLTDFSKGGKGYSSEDRARINKADADYKKAIEQAKTEFKKARKAERNERYMQKKESKIQAKEQYNSIKTDFQRAKAKAKVDKEYKKSEEYRQAKSKYSKQKVSDFMLGKNGTKKVYELKNKGDSKEAAVAKVVVASVLAGAAYVGLSALTNPYR